MAHVWMTGGSGEWTAVPLDGDAFALTGAPQQRDADLPAATPGASVCRFVQIGTAEQAGWALVSGVDVSVFVNGLPAPLGIVALQDRDEIRLGDGRLLYFSSETLARVEPFRAAGRTTCCARCKLPILAGTNALRCPACGVWHHAADDRGCWTYDTRCAMCPQETALDVGFRWTPADL